MSRSGAKLGIGTHLRLDVETVQLVEFASFATEMEAVLKDGRDRLARMSVRELLSPGRTQLIPSSAGSSAADY
ncbi:hypothetical protein [Streptomyces sp. NPDC058701]|uniref:hypothetical protein n=1 Tax=Streptomyces sp. NPDC058701 TaxID=3346608 RepID=UPI003652D1A5